MTQVRILPEILSNQIAAGEVVERPASVVKELVENSIDAGATDITVEIVRGGKSLIRVSDNGTGLPRDDALLAIERYATSKIFSKEDLFSISTMGFRGEALPSISSVSKFTLVTRPKEAAVGTRLEIAGGKVIDVNDAGAPAGTMVEVKSLFFNTPARKKFLKTDNTEISHISDMVSSAALGQPHIRFRLFSNNRLQKSFPKSDDLFQRAVHVLGQDVSTKLFSLKFKDEYLTIGGVAAHPSITRSSSAKIFLFVNNRLIYDRGLVSSLFQGYKGRIMKGRFPLAALFVNIGYDQVDVNVHPAKREVKFFNYQRVYQAVLKAVAEGLATAQKNVAEYTATQIVNPGATKDRKPEPADDRLLKMASTTSTTVQQKSFDWSGIKSRPTGQNQPSQIREPMTRFREEVPGRASPVPAFDRVPLQSESTEKPDLRIVGQVLDTYIIAETDDGMVLIDQHAAHERIVYENLKKRHMAMGILSQSLLVPETIELTGKEADLLESMLEEFNNLGIDIEPFGGTTFVVKAVPQLISRRQVKTLIVDIIEKAGVDKNAFKKESWLDDCLLLMACHHALRANRAMHQKEMEQLLLDLEKCDNPMHCPHGRPIKITLTRDELEKLFKRVV